MTSLEEIQDRIFRPMPVTVAYAPTLREIRESFWSKWITPDVLLYEAGVVSVPELDRPDAHFGSFHRRNRRVAP